jgi:hypothetical protein
MAMRLAGITKRAQIIGNADQFADCLQAANLMIGQANTNRLMVYSIQIDAYQLTAAKQFTLGPGGSLVSVQTGLSVRPPTNSIDRAVLVYNFASPGAPIRLPIYVMNNQEWAAIKLQDIPNAIPTRLYCDYANPTANIYLWTQDTGADQLELHTWQTLSKIQTVDDLVSWPDGYEDWFVNNLAVRLASIFHSEGASVTDDTRAEALRSAAAIQSMNAPTPLMDVDAGVFPVRGGRSGWNRFTGD